MELLSPVSPSAFGGEILANRRIFIDSRAVGGQNGELAGDTAGQAAAQTSGAVVRNDGVIYGHGALTGHKNAAAAQVSGRVAGVVSDRDCTTGWVDCSCALQADAAAFGGLCGIVGNYTARHFKCRFIITFTTPDSDPAAGSLRRIVGDLAPGHVQRDSSHNRDSAAALGCDPITIHHRAGCGVVRNLTAQNIHGAVPSGVNAAALRRGVAGDHSALFHGQGAVFHKDAAALRSGGVACDRTALQGQGAADHSNDRSPAQRIIVDPHNGPAFVATGVLNRQISVFINTNGGVTSIIRSFIIIFYGVTVQI